MEDTHSKNLDLILSQEERRSEDKEQKADLSNKFTLYLTTCGIHVRMCPHVGVCCVCF